MRDPELKSVMTITAIEVQADVLYSGDVGARAKQDVSRQSRNIPISPILVNLSIAYFGTLW
jgi:hypothetical protein